mmetsp:Transcript_54052/g.118271  ORF Transcript_54052/g.118271 Transcript_54052/m.118271 type:complete len:214 (+) Transcript_54052:689-1330(+)
MLWKVPKALGWTSACPATSTASATSTDSVISAAAAAAAAAEITESVDVAEAVEVAGQAEVQPKALGTFHSIVRSDATTAAFSSRGGHPFFETSEEKSVGSYSSSGGHVARLEPSVPCELPTALTARRPLARPLKESDTTVRQKKFGPPEGECCEAAGGSVREAALKDLENLLSSLMPANKFRGRLEISGTDCAAQFDSCCSCRRHSVGNVLDE